MSLLVLSAPVADAREVCVEELSGVCLRYETRPDPPKPKAQAPVSPAAAAERALRLSAADRRDVQRGLRAEGYYRGAIDGAIGRGSRRAIRDWQQASGLSPTGYLDLTQVAMLRRLSAAQPAPTQPRQTPAVADTAKAAPAQSQTADPVVGRTYSERRGGSSGTEIVVSVEVRSPSSAKVRVRIDSIAAGTFDQSCDAPLSGAFRCRLRGQRGWSERLVEGDLPNLTLQSEGSASSGIYRFSFWES